jgi:hypothetical protein
MQFQGTNIFQQLTLKQKISIVISLIAAVILLFFFAVTIFFVALGIGFIILISRLPIWDNRSRTTYTTTKKTRIYRHDPAKDDDVIDV